MIPLTVVFVSELQRLIARLYFFVASESVQTIENKFDGEIVLGHCHSTNVLSGSWASTCQKMRQTQMCMLYAYIN